MQFYTEQGAKVALFCRLNKRKCWQNAMAQILLFTLIPLAHGPVECSSTWQKLSDPWGLFIVCTPFYALSPLPKVRRIIFSTSALAFSQI
ncbi:MAG: hypothetical protein ACRENG_31605, partial [bacterium]